MHAGPTYIKPSSYHLYSPFLIYTIQAYIWSHPLKSFGSLLLHFLSLTLESLSPYHSFNLLNNCIIDVGLLVSITYNCLFSKETLYALHNTQEGHIKHACISNHYIHETVEFGEVKLYYVSTNQQYADIFMKNLAKLKFETGKKALCLIKYS